MADNVIVSPGAGVTIAADEVVDGTLGTVKVQYVKLMDGTLDGASKALVDANGLAVKPNGGALGTVSDVAYSGSGDGTLIAVNKKLVAQFAAGFAISGSVSMADAEGVKGQFGGLVGNPTGVYTRPADTTAYAALDLVSNNTTAGSITVQTAGNVARVAAGSFQADRLRLNSNHTTGLLGTNFKVRLWTAAPTYSNGDNGAYAVATGAAGYLGSFTGTFEQFADGACALLLPDAGSPCVKLASGQVIYWDMQTLDIFTPQSAKTFTLTVEVKQD